MNRETIAFGMTEHAGIAFLIVTVLCAGAFELVRSRFAQVRPRRQTRRLSRRARKDLSHPERNLD